MILTARLKHPNILATVIRSCASRSLVALVFELTPRGTLRATWDSGAIYHQRATWDSAEKTSAPPGQDCVCLVCTAKSTWTRAKANTRDMKSTSFLLTDYLGGKTSG